LNRFGKDWLDLGKFD